jgi:peptidoglycan-associated lipoprotein
MGPGGRPPRSEAPLDGSRSAQTEAVPPTPSPGPPGRLGASVLLVEATRPAQAEARPVLVSWQSVEDIAFEHEKADLMPRCQKKIGRLAAWVKKNPTVEVALDARADEALTGERDPQIGRGRVQAVRAALIAEGVAPTQIHSTAYHAQRVLCTQATSACYDRNRRVEVFFGQRD